MATIDRIDEFSCFAGYLSEKDVKELSLDVTFDRWYEGAFRDEELLRIKASFWVCENGKRGQHAEEVLNEFRADRAAGKNK